MLCIAMAMLCVLYLTETQPALEFGESKRKRRKWQLDYLYIVLIASTYVWFNGDMCDSGSKTETLRHLRNRAPSLPIPTQTKPSPCPCPFPYKEKRDGTGTRTSINFFNVIIGGGGGGGGFLKRFSCYFSYSLHTCGEKRSSYGELRNSTSARSTIPFSSSPFHFISMRMGWDGIGRR